MRNRRTTNRHRIPPYLLTHNTPRRVVDSPDPRRASRRIKRGLWGFRAMSAIMIGCSFLHGCEVDYGTLKPIQIAGAVAILAAIIVALDHLAAWAFKGAYFGWKEARR